jgi:uncharacterized protein YjbI with pentapeptide repeats
VKLSFNKSLIRDCNISELNLTGTTFTDCEINRCDFYKSNLSKTIYKGSSLPGSLFESTNLSGADFSEAINYKINPANNKIKGAKFSYPEVLNLLSIFEIEIE